MLIQKKTADCILMAGIIFFILCPFALFTGIAPTFIVPWTASKYRALMSDHNKEAKDKKDRIIGIGSEVKLELPGERSIGGHYAIRSARFVPSDSKLSRWKGKEKSRDWGESLVEDMKGFDIEVQILVPDDPKLEGRTVDGELHVDFVYPVKTKSGVIIGKFSNYSDSIRKPMSIHVFTAEEVRQLTKIWDKMASARGWLAVFFFFGGILLMSALPKLERSTSYQEFAIQIAPLVVAITVCLCVNRLVVWAYGHDPNVLELLAPLLSLFLVLFVAGKLRQMSAQRTKVEDKLVKERKKKV